MTAKTMKKRREFPYPETSYLEVHGKVTENQCFTKSFRFRLKTKIETKAKYFPEKRLNMMKS